MSTGTKTGEGSGPREMFGKRPQQANPPPRHLPSNQARAGRGLRDSGQVDLDDAEDFRKRWLLVFLLQQ